MTRQGETVPLALAVAIGLLSFSAWCERATIEVHVIDSETGEPLPGVKVCGEFLDATPWRLIGKGSLPPRKVFAETDSKGACHVRGETDCGKASAWVRDPPPGYYPSRMGIEYRTTGAKKFGHWLPKVIVGTIPLQKKGRCIPLVERVAWSGIDDGAKTNALKSSFSLTFAYDLFEGKWLPPRGKGKHADVVVTSEYEVTDVKTNVWNGKIREEEFFTWRHTFSTPGKGNGIRVFHPSPMQWVRVPRAVDEGLTPSLTRVTGCRPVFDGERWVKEYFNRDEDKTVAYALRIRSEFDECGKLKRAYYARIDREVLPSNFYYGEKFARLDFTAYLNPLANDRNLEAGPPCPGRGSNLEHLAKKTYVDVSVPAHDPVKAAALVQSEIDEKSRDGGGEICLGPGEIEMAPLVLRSGIALYLKKGTTLLASTNVEDYAGHPAFISAEDADDVSIFGEGVIDGRGGAFPAGEGFSGEAPDLVRFERCPHVQLEGNDLRNAAARGICLKACDRASVVRTRYSNRMNTPKEGLRIISGETTEVCDCEFDTFGDAIVSKPEPGENGVTSSLSVYRSKIRSWGNAIRLETGERGKVFYLSIGHVKVERPEYVGANVLAREAAIEVEAQDAGKVQAVSCRNCDVSSGALAPFAFRMVRRHADQSLHEPVTPAISEVEIKDFKGRSEGPVACTIFGLPDARLGSVGLDNVCLTYQDGDTVVTEARESGPAWGLHLDHVDYFGHVDLTLKSERSDGRPEMVTNDVGKVYDLPRRRK